MQVSNFKELYIYILIFCNAGLIVPLPGVLTSLIDNDLRFLQTEYPTTLCTTASYRLWFYSYTLPGSFALGIGSILLVIVIWTIHKVIRLMEHNMNV